MEREYIKIKKQSPLPVSSTHQKKLNDDVWKGWIFYHLLTFYKNYNRNELNGIIKNEVSDRKSNIEDEIALYIRNQIKRNEKYKLFGLQGFKILGGVNNDEKKKGLYDISILHSYWKNENGEDGEFHFECKNLTLTPKQNYISKYVYYNEKECGVYRFFNGKYANDQNFGGMIGFVLEGEILEIKKKIQDKLKDKFDISPEGDLISINDNSIQNNNFTFDSLHKRNGKKFLLHHLLFDFS